MSFAPATNTGLTWGARSGCVTFGLRLATATNADLADGTESISATLREGNALPIDAFIIRGAIRGVSAFDHSSALVANADFTSRTPTIDPTFNLPALTIHTAERWLAVQVGLTRSSLAGAVQTDQTVWTLVIVQAAIDTLSLQTASSGRTVRVFPTLRYIDAAALNTGLSRSAVTIDATLSDHDASLIDAGRTDWTILVIEALRTVYASILATDLSVRAILREATLRGVKAAAVSTDKSLWALTIIHTLRARDTAIL